MRVQEVGGVEQGGAKLAGGGLQPASALHPAPAPSFPAPSLTQIPLAPAPAPGHCLSQRRARGTMPTGLWRRRTSWWGRLSGCTRAWRCPGQTFPCQPSGSDCEAGRGAAASARQPSWGALLPTRPPAPPRPRKTQPARAPLAAGPGPSPPLSSGQTDLCIIEFLLTGPAASVGHTLPLWRARLFPAARRATGW